MASAEEHTRDVQPQLPFLSALSEGGKAYGMSAISSPVNVLRGWHQYFVPSDYKPNATKTYEIRPHLPLNVFLPVSHTASTSAATLPTLFTIHGGGFTVGSPGDDDKWNRHFADTHNFLVVALNYSKAPRYPFPTGVHDLEALISATLDDDSIPIDKHRCAIAGFSAGGNLAVVMAQSQAVKTSFEKHNATGFSAVVPVYALLDRTFTRDFKATQRRYKPNLTPYRNSDTDILLRLGKSFDWAYVPVGQDLKDARLSPIFAPRETLPAQIFVIACELDCSNHEAWRMASRLAGRTVPPLDEKPGRDENGKVGELELEDERFSWEVTETGVRWMLIPDVIHGYDRMHASMLGDETTVRDAEEKDIKVQKEIADWLKTRVWAE